MKKFFALSIMLLLCLSLCVACAQQSPEPAPAASTPAPTPEPASPEPAPAPTSRQVTDMGGRTVELPLEINRIGTLGSVGVLNAFVELMGEGDKIFNEMPGRFKSSGSWDMQYKFAPQILDAPLYEDANGEILIETIIETQPDVCFVMSKDTAQVLEQNNIACIYLEWRDLDDVKTAVNLMGEVLNRQDMSQKYIAYFDEKLAFAQSLTAGLSDEQRLSVLYGNPVTFSQPHIIAEWWIEQAGGVSVTSEMNTGESLTYTLEDLLLWNPDVMIVSGQQQVADMQADNRYSDITAVKNGAIYVIPTVAHVWGNRTVEQPLTILWTMHHLYPELVNHDSLAQEIKDFYSTFFQYDISDEDVAAIIEGR